MSFLILYFHLYILGVRHFSETILEKENSIPLEILKHVYNIHLSQNSKMDPSNGF